MTGARVRVEGAMGSRRARRNSILAPLAVVIACMMAAVLHAHAAPTTQEEPYVAGTHAFTYGFCATSPDNPTGSNIGAVCFEKTTGSRVDLTIVDQSGLPVGAVAVYIDLAGDPHGPIDEQGSRGWKICGAGRIPTVPDWYRLEVYVGDPLLGPVACATEGVEAVGIGTTGTVRATFRP